MSPVAGFNINDFKAQYQDLARGYTFFILVSMPGAVGSDSPDRTKFLVSSSTIPAQTNEALDIQWMGQKFPVGSVSTYSDWGVTFKLDAAAKLRKDFIKWSYLVHNPITNVHGRPSEYMMDQEIWHLSTQGDIISKTKLVNAFPTVINALTLDYATTDIPTFEVTFRYLYHVEI